MENAFLVLWNRAKSGSAHGQWNENAQTWKLCGMQGGEVKVFLPAIACKGKERQKNSTANKCLRK